MDEDQRIASLHELDVLDSEADAGLDDLAELASAICGTPMSLVSLVDAQRVWVMSSFGIAVTETSREVSFCTHAIRQDDTFIVEDAARDTRFCDNPHVLGDPNLRFYAGVPLHAPDGAPVGTLCVLDVVPRHLTKAQLRALSILAMQVQGRIDLRYESKCLRLAQEKSSDLLAKLRSSNELFLAFMNHGPFASYMKRADGGMVFYNRMLAERFQVDLDTWLGKTDHELWPAEMADTFRRNDIAVLAGGVPVELEETSPGPNDQPIFWKSYKFPLRDCDGTLLLAGISIDISREIEREASLQQALETQRRLTRELENTRHLYQNFMDHHPNNVYIKDADGRYVFYNKCFAEFFGIDEQAWLGKMDSEVRDSAAAASFRAQDLQVLGEEKMLATVSHVVDAEGALHSFKSFKFPCRALDGGQLVAGVAVDMTEQWKREEALADANALLEFLATTDALTGLLNRRVFGERAETEFAVARRKTRPLSLLLLDVDDFKRRNDQYGHDAGDDALRTLGGVLNQCLRAGDTCARLGGEEFGYLLPDTDLAGALALAERVRMALRKAPQGPAPLTLSIGVTSITDETTNWERLLSLADEAMYCAKREGKDRVSVANAPAVRRFAARSVSSEPDWLRRRPA